MKFLSTTMTIAIFNRHKNNYVTIYTIVLIHTILINLTSTNWEDNVILHLYSNGNWMKPTHLYQATYVPEAVSTEKKIFYNILEDSLSVAYALQH